ncbi:hypothetical protein FRX31_031547 [Thalictrum thalictroides]|uniref:Uncharacterized protein n=1 Tax=Thalictrum thalictroides TaxID=46969 RepID=A0A7J6V1K6_THATH|nr:hypothetical protein FRX31_031547 [Thalictrum thalictroides]
MPKLFLPLNFSMSNFKVDTFPLEPEDGSDIPITFKHQQTNQTNETQKSFTKTTRKPKIGFSTKPGKQNRNFKELLRTEYFEPENVPYTVGKPEEFSFQPKKRINVSISEHKVMAVLLQGIKSGQIPKNKQNPSNNVLQSLLQPKGTTFSS